MLKEEYLRDEKMMRLDLSTSRKEVTEIIRLSSMYCERKITNSLRQIDRMLDKMNLSEDPTVITRCKASIERCRKDLVKYEYYGGVVDNGDSSS